jgi:hypothetical protein
MGDIFVFIADFGLFGAMLGSVFYLRDVKPLFAMLRTRHPALWRELGMPEIPEGVEQSQMDRMVGSAFGMPVMKFLLLGRFRDSGDRDFADQCEKSRRRLAFVLFSAGLLAVIAVPMVIIDMWNHGLR